MATVLISMADRRHAFAENAEGDWFVDTSCIDCDACRIIAPAVFADAGDHSFVAKQPSDESEVFRAAQALVTCPTASIGGGAKEVVARAVESYPELLDSNVYFCGFASEHSFGALSYLVRRDAGNLLVDSPRFNHPLARNIAKLGGVSTMLLTHRDDVADHEKFSSHFDATRVLHRDDVTRRTAAVEQQPGGSNPIQLDEDVVMIPVPGHTKGHAVYLYRDEFLFTGDHLAWNEKRGTLYAFHSACWYSWSEQIESMKKLLDFTFEWVLPGHGRRVHLDPKRMRGELEKCIEWMKTK